MEKINNEECFKKYIIIKSIERRTSLKMYEILWEKEVICNGNIVTLETLKYRNWTIKDSFKNIRKLN